MIRKVCWFAPIGALVIISSAWIYFARARVGIVGAAPQVNSPAPEFSLRALDGQQVSLSDLRGAMVLVNFWATWCMPCRAEIAEIESVYHASGSQNLSVLLIDEQEDVHIVAEFARTYHLTLPVLLDKDGEVGKRYLVRGLPTSFFIDSKGIIRAVNAGGMNRAYIESQLGVLGGSTTSGIVNLTPAVPSEVGKPERLNLEEIFPPGNGRELALRNCTSCHAVNFIAFVRKTNGRWASNKANHEERFPALSPVDVETMYDYLAAKFNPEVPLPKLPPELWAPCDT